jgi:hypothetical protein
MVVVKFSNPGSSSNLCMRKLWVDVMTFIVGHVFFLENNDCGHVWFSLEDDDGVLPDFSYSPTSMLYPVPLTIRNLLFSSCS